MKILFYNTRAYDQKSFEQLSSNYPDIEITYIESPLDCHTVKIAEGYDAICVFVNSYITTALMTTLKELGVKLILLRCAGFNNVNLIAAKKCGIKVMRVPGYSPESVAEMAAALLMGINRKIHKAYTRVRDNNFSLNGLSGLCLYGKTVGILGYGRIGKCFANICRGFGMHVIAYDPYLLKNNITMPDVKLVDLETLYHRADIISLHMALNADTVHFIDADAIAQMKDNVILLNVSRGPLVDNEALIDGIRAGKFFGVGLDVYEGEDDNVYTNHEDDILPSSICARLLSFPNVLITSHQAFLTDVALEQIAQTTLENARDFIQGNESANYVQ